LTGSEPVFPIGHILTNEQLLIIMFTHESRRELLNKERAMTVKIIIERSMSPDKLEYAVDLLTNLRSMAMHRQGYISGETLFAIDRPGTHAVISTWESLSSWKDWEHNSERLRINNMIEALLTSPSKYSAYETARYVAEGT
jgi:heme-degrading monooxygenase HmoA